MWRKVFEIIRSCTKKIFGALVTMLGIVAIKAAEVWNSVTAAVSEGVNWVAEQAKAVEAAKLSKVAILHTFTLFIGGLICCFLFPEEARGDLTWFRKMLITAMDWSSIVVNSVKNRVVEYLNKYWEVEVT